MVVSTLLLAAVGFALLVAALVSGSVIWAWACIAVCVVGVIVLLVSAFSVVRELSAERSEQAPSRQVRHNRHGHR